MAEIAVHEYGNPSGPTMILVHGVTDSGECWPDAVEHWGESWRILAVDQRGHGDSPHFTEENVERSTDLWRDDLIAVLREQEEPAVVVGHSLGGMAGLRAAEKEPALVRALVLEDPARSLTGAGVDQEFVDGTMALVKDFSSRVDSEKERMRRETPWSQTEIDAWAVAKSQADLLMIERGLDLNTGPWEQTFDELKMPTLVLGPVDSDMMPEPALIGNPLVEVAFLDGVGHCVRRDGPRVYYSLVDEFLRSVGFAR